MLRTLHVRRSLILIVLCLLTLGTLPGQMRRGMLTGTVTDARGRPLKGVSVQLESVATLRSLRRSLIKPVDTGFTVYVPIHYKLKANYHGKWSAEEYLSRFDAKRQLNKIWNQIAAASVSKCRSSTRTPQASAAGAWLRTLRGTS